MRTTTTTKDLFKKYEGKFDVDNSSSGKPFVVSAIVRDTGEVLFENKILNGMVAKSKAQRGVGHVLFTDPESKMQYKRWRADDNLKNAITNETVKIILVKVVEAESESKEGEKESYYRIFIAENKTLLPTKMVVPF